MDYQLIIFLSKKELMAVDITEDGDCEEVSIDGNPSMSYRSVEDFADFKQYICDAYNVDEIEEMEAGATIVNCGADTETSIALLEELKGFKGIDAIDVTKLLPIVAQNKGLLKKNEKILFSVMGNCFAVKCDDEGVAKTIKNKLSNNAVELEGADFGFLYFFKTNGSSISESELKKLQEETEKRIRTIEESASSRITTVEAKYSNLLNEYQKYKKIVDDIEAEKRKKRGRFCNLHMGDIVKFGKYYIDSNIKQDIEWQVLEVKNNRVLLLSKYGIERREFGYETKWEFSEMRKWLNGIFLKSIFTEEDLTYIDDSIIDNTTQEEEYLENYTPLSGLGLISAFANQQVEERKQNLKKSNKTKDKLFLLSCRDMEDYFIDANARICMGTKHTGTNSGCYFLRTEGDNNDSGTHICFVGTNGKVESSGYYGSGNSVSKNYLVRPALWIKLED